MLNLITRPVLIGLGVALGISVAGNAFLINRWIEAREEVGALEKERDQARGEAKQCSDGVADLRKRADKAEQAAKAARAAAQSARATLNRKADAVLSAPPTVPGDDCRSAGDRFNNWLGATR